MNGPRAATGTVLQDERRGILLIRRGPDSLNGAGEWSIPGGKVDPGETAAEAAARELFEETGVRAEVRDLDIVTDDDHWGPELHFHTSYHQAVSPAGEPRIMEPHKHDGMQWVRPERLAAMIDQPDPAFPLFPPTRAFVAAGGLDRLLPSNTRSDA